MSFVDFAKFLFCLEGGGRSHSHYYQPVPSDGTRRAHLETLVHALDKLMSVSHRKGAPSTFCMTDPGKVPTSIEVNVSDYPLWPSFVEIWVDRDSGTFTIQFVVSGQNFTLSFELMDDELSLAKYEDGYIRSVVADAVWQWFSQHKTT